MWWYRAPNQSWTYHWVRRAPSPGVGAPEAGRQRQWGTWFWPSHRPLPLCGSKTEPSTTWGVEWSGTWGWVTSGGGQRVDCMCTQFPGISAWDMTSLAEAEQSQQGAGEPRVWEGSCFSGSGAYHIQTHFLALIHGPVISLLHV